jgi:hypothetical protein
MVPPDDGAPEARPPRLTDLAAMCRRLNEAGARYVVIGGMAVIQAGFVRATEDIDLLVDTSVDNIHRVRQALLSLPDQAVNEMADADLERYVVVRVADEIVIAVANQADAARQGQDGSCLSQIGTAACGSELSANQLPPRSARNSDPGSTPLTNRRSRARVHATYSNWRSVS